MAKRIFNENVNIEKIETGFMVTVRDEHYNSTYRAFPTWKETVKWVESNPPKQIVSTDGQ